MVGVSNRRDAMLATGISDQESYGLVRCYLKRRGAPWSAGLTAAESCDLLFSIGTSGLVYPAAELPLRALSAGATVVHVNPVRFEISSQEYFIHGPATALQTLIKVAFG